MTKENSKDLISRDKMTGYIIVNNYTTEITGNGGSKNQKIRIYPNKNGNDILLYITEKKTRGYEIVDYTGVSVKNDYTDHPEKGYQIDNNTYLDDCKNFLFNNNQDSSVTEIEFINYKKLRFKFRSGFETVIKMKTKNETPLAL